MRDIDRIAERIFRDIGVIDDMSTPTELGEIKDVIRAGLFEYGAIVRAEMEQRTVVLD